MSARRDMVHPPALQAIKAAFRAAVRAAGGTDAVAAQFGRRQQAVSDYGLPNTDVFPPLDLVAQVEDITHGLPGHPHVTRALALHTGHVVVRLPDVGCGADVATWHGGMGALAKEAGDVTAKICTALADDGDVSGDEADALLTEIDQAAEALAVLRLLAVVAAR